MTAEVEHCWQLAGTCSLEVRDSGFRIVLTVSFIMIACTQESESNPSLVSWNITAPTIVVHLVKPLLGCALIES